MALPTQESISMITATKTLYLYVETPLHAGVGSGLSSIDLPIQRERTTQYPMIQGSGIKGKLRSVAETLAEHEHDEQARKRAWEKVTLMFGPRESGADHAGALIAGDARILLFPVRSLSGVFAYTTCYDVLGRFKRDRERNGDGLPWDVPAAVNSDPPRPPVALVTNDSQVSVSGTVVLEEFSFQARVSEDADKIADWIAAKALPGTYNYWREKLRRSLVILPDNDFRDFALYATEIITRVRIDRATKTVAGGALWTEEHLPSDTLLYVPMYATDSRKARSNGEQAMSAADILQEAIALENSQGGYIQLGGDETVGRGLVRLHWESEASEA
jgi:CRISPR-associated protein Cmr4